jgi:predicted dehydrogenase
MVLRIGLLGASRIAPKAVIAPASRRSDVAITAVAARDLDRAKVYAEQHAIPLALPGYAALAEHDEVDVVYCALPPAAHLEWCLAALAGGKALLVEKPFALNADEAAQIVQAAERAGRPALEAFHYRFHSQFARALEIVRSGRLGRLQRADGVFNAQIAERPGELRWRPETGGGGVMDLGCYVLHALRTLMGAEPAVESVQAELRHGVDATLDAELRFPSDVESRLQCSMLAPRHDEIVLVGERGRLRLSAFVSPQNGGRLQLTAPGSDLDEAAEGPSSYDAQLAHLVDVMSGAARPLTGGPDAIANMAVLDAVRLAAGMTIKAR